MFVVTIKQTAVAGRDTRRELHVVGHQGADQAHHGYRVHPAGAAATDAIPQEALD
jgi:hypothetical protein